MVTCSQLGTPNSPAIPAEGAAWPGASSLSSCCRCSNPARHLCCARRFEALLQLAKNRTIIVAPAYQVEDAAVARSVVSGAVLLRTALPGATQHRQTRSGQTSVDGAMERCLTSDEVMHVRGVQISPARHGPRSLGLELAWRGAKQRTANCTMNC